MVNVCTDCYSSDYGGGSSGVPSSTDTPSSISSVSEMEELADRMNVSVIVTCLYFVFSAVRETTRFFHFRGFVIKETLLYDEFW